MVGSVREDAGEVSPRWIRFPPPLPKIHRATMIGALVGDIVGSVHEFIVTKETDFPLFATATRFTARH